MILYFKYEYERKSILKNSRTEVLSTIHKIYIAIWFLLHVLGYIIQLSFHVVDVNINLDLYKCIRINHRNVSLQKENEVSVPFSVSTCQNSLWCQKMLNQINLKSQNSLISSDHLKNGLNLSIKVFGLLF